nr:putative reverse transcriptase domain-containing protein [Tanacetum cinerariifolium]
MLNGSGSVSFSQGGVKVLSSSGVALYCDDTIKALEAKHPYKSPISMSSNTFSEPPLVAEINSVFGCIKLFPKGKGIRVYKFILVYVASIKWVIELPFNACLLSNTRKVKESLNVTFDETPSPSKTSPLVDDDLDEEETIKFTEKKNLENDIEDETFETDEIVGTLRAFDKELMSSFNSTIMYHTSSRMSIELLIPRASGPDIGKCDSECSMSRPGSGGEEAADYDVYHVDY